MYKSIRSLSLGLVACLLPLEAAATEWNVSLWGKRRAFTEHVEKLAETVAFTTNGEFTITLNYGGLAKNRENLDGIAAGDFEMAQFCAGYHRDKNPTITVMELPFLGIQSLEEELAVSHALYAHPATVADLARWNAKLLMATPLPQYNLVGTGTAPSDLQSLAGARIRATGGIGQAFRSIGAEPVSATATETFAAMESGDVEMVAFAQHAHFAFRTINLGEWWTSNLNPGTLNCPVVVNTDAYAALPEAHRAALDAAVAPALDHYLTYYQDLIHKWDEILELFGVEKVTFTDSEIAAFRAQAAAPVRAAWIADQTAANVPAADLVAFVEQSIQDFRDGKLTAPKSN